MKKLLTLLTALLIISSVNAQEEYRIKHDTGNIIIEGVDEVNITSHSGNEVVFSIDRHDDHEDLERAKGLRIMNSQGLIDNSNIGLSVKKDGNNLLVNQVGKCQCSDGEGYSIKIPKSMGIEYSHSTHESDKINITDISKEIIISTNYSDVKLNNVTGPMAIKTVYGDIEGKFGSVNQTNSIDINSVYGFVDISLPASTTADLSIQTPYGEVYTDLDIDLSTDSEMKKLSSSSISGKLNGGGVDIQIQSSYENVYLRKN